MHELQQYFLAAAQPQQYSAIQNQPSSIVTGAATHFLGLPYQQFYQPQPQPCFSSVQPISVQQKQTMDVDVDVVKATGGITKGAIF